MPPKRFEGKFGIPPSHPVESLLTQALYRLPESVDNARIEELTKDISNKVSDARVREGQSKLSPAEAQTLKLKLVRHFEDNGESAPIDVPTAVDALVESPKFLGSDKGSMEKLFELHEMKTLQKIAEIRKKRAEMHESNVYENLFETKNGKYYLARLLNMPHLEEESAYMKHCVGTSTSYVNKIKEGKVEIFSFRTTGEDKPIITIEYDTKSHQLLQVKAYRDRIPTLADDFAPDLIEAVESLSETIDDAGQKREVRNKEVIHLRTLLALKDKPKEAYTREDLTFLYEIDEPIRGFEGRDPLADELRKTRKVEEDTLIIFDCTPAQIAHTTSEIKETTKAYIGPLTPGTLDKLTRTLEHIYTSFPEGRVKQRTIELGGFKDGKAFETELEKKGMKTNEWSQHLLESPDFKVLGTHEQADLIELSVASLGFNTNTRYDKICERAKELGLDLCPAEVGPQLRLQYTDQPQGEWFILAMKAISDRDGHPGLFDVHHVEDGLWLDAAYGLTPSRGIPGFGLSSSVPARALSPYVLNPLGISALGPFDP